jgi:transposase
MVINKLKFRRVQFRGLTYSQWQIIKKLINNAERKRKYDLKNILECILKVTRTGVQWRNIDAIYPPWQVVTIFVSGKVKGYGIKYLLF